MTEPILRIRNVESFYGPIMAIRGVSLDVHEGQIVSILGFAVLAQAGPVLWLLGAVIAFEYLGVGMGTAAFTAFIARETSPLFAATQFSLFTALAAIPRTFANASTGFIVEYFDWVTFFLLCAVVAIPGLLLLPWVAPWRGEEASTSDSD